MSDFLERKSTSYPKKITFNWTTGKNFSKTKEKEYNYTFKNEFCKTDIDTTENLTTPTCKSCEKINSLLNRQLPLDHDPINCKFVPLNNESRMIKIDLNKLFPLINNEKNTEKKFSETLLYQNILKKFQDLQKFLLKHNKGTHDELQYISDSITKLLNYLKKYQQ